MKKKFAAKEGFTLVELIVVIAILGILAAVAVPTYSGYIKKAQDAADMQTLSSIATAVQGVVAGKGDTVVSIEVAAANDITVQTGTLMAEATKLTEGTAIKLSEITALTGTALTFGDNFSSAKVVYSGTGATDGWVITHTT